MLEYTSLQFIPVILLSREDAWVHTTTLLLRCTSLIHHSQKYTTWQLDYVDRLNCLLVTIVYCYRSYEYGRYINYSVLVYDIMMYYWYMKVYGWNKYIHASIHTLSAIVGFRCIK